MRTVTNHFCGYGNRNSALQKTVWDDLGPDRHEPGSNKVRWHYGKPRMLMTGGELPMFIRELSRVNHGVIVELGTYLGGSAWWGAQIAADNWCEYHCVDHWQGDAMCSADENTYRAFILNMQEAGLLDAIQVHRKTTVEAAADFADEVG